MNVFVLCTGRCGSKTFAKACSHIENFTASHESLRGALEKRIYPENHIEVDNSLSWLLGRLDALYADEAFYVHLTRNKEDTVNSFLSRPATVPEAYGQLIGVSIKGRREEVCNHYYHTVNQNIESFLENKTKKMSFFLESAHTDFREFWNRIDADGNLERALEEWERTYNASSAPGAEKSDTLSERVFKAPLRATRKVGRIVRKFPEFVSRA